MGIFGLLKNKKKVTDNNTNEKNVQEAATKENNVKSPITVAPIEKKSVKSSVSKEVSEKSDTTKTTATSKSSAPTKKPTNATTSKSNDTKVNATAVKSTDTIGKASAKNEAQPRIVKTTVLVTKVEPKKTLNASSVRATVVTQETNTSKADEKVPTSKGNVTKSAAVKSAVQKSAEATVNPTTPEITEGYTGKFEINKSKDGKKYFFNLYASNKVGIATSQMYSSSQGALNGVKSVIANASTIPVEDQSLKKYESLPYPKWEIYVDNGGKFRFRLCASNGSCVCHSQGYTTKNACKNGIDSIIRSSKNAEIVKTYITKKDEN